MKKLSVLAFIAMGFMICISFTNQSLRHQYSRPAAEWPAPRVDEGVSWTELGVLPPVPVDLTNDSIKNIVELVKPSSLTPVSAVPEKFHVPPVMILP